MWRAFQVKNLSETATSSCNIFNLEAPIKGQQAYIPKKWAQF